jgi:Na+-driven multidrug efflux pump
VLLRILRIVLGLSFVLMAALSFGNSAIPRVFTSDLEVIAVTKRVMPLLAFFMVRTALEGCFRLCPVMGTV